MSFTKRRPLDDRFWEKVDRREPGECWPWLACTNALGYGSIFVEKVDGVARSMLAHRVSYELQYGPLPDGLIVLHSCDTPGCVNPAHLRAGTNADNAADREQRRRGNQPKGAASPNAKLTDDDIRAIRAAYPHRSQREIGELFGVAQTTVSKVVRGKAWAHVGEAA
jgi:hypothetical protein